MNKLKITLPDTFLDEEYRTLLVPVKRKQAWAVLLDLLVQFDRVCKKYGIKYFCDGGTSLGAVRHKGFIPWDDDIDIVMTRKEYEKLCAVGAKEFEHPYFFQTNDTDPGSLRGHAQLRNSTTTAILKSEMWGDKAANKFNQGMFIDIFPFDNLPDDVNERAMFLAEMQKKKDKLLQIKLEHLRFRMLLRYPFSPRAIFHGLLPLVKHMLAFKSWNLRMTKVHDEMVQFAQKYDDIVTKEMAPISFNPYNRYILPAEFFNDAVELDFEFIKIPVFKHYNEALTINYGNWHEHVIGVSSHGDMLIDLEHPYTDYV